MRILFSPQVTLNNKKIKYKFDKEVITATIGEITDVFDFSQFVEDGYVDKDSIETVFSHPVVISASRDNGVLSVELINFISEDALYEDRFPDWIEV